MWPFKRKPKVYSKLCMDIVERIKGAYTNLSISEQAFFINGIIVYNSLSSNRWSIGSNECELGELSQDDFLKHENRLIKQTIVDKINSLKPNGENDKKKLIEKFLSE